MNVKEIRKSLGLSQQGFALKIGVSISVVQKWEIGKRNPGKKSMEKIDKLVGEEK